MTEFKDVGIPAVFRQLPIEQDKPSIDMFFSILQDLIRVLDERDSNLKAILDRGGSFDDNMDVRRVSVVSHVTPGTEFSVAHTLGKVPLGYITAGQNAAGSVRDGTTSNTATTLFLKSDASSATFRLIVF
jgi:hypothetical protein